MHVALVMDMHMAGLESLDQLTVLPRVVSLQIHMHIYD